MAACIIFKKDLEQLGKKLMKDFYHHVHDDYFLTTFDEVKLERDYYDKNLVDKFLIFHENKEKKFKNLYFGNKKYEEIVKMPPKDLLKKIEGKILDETLNYKIIFDFLYGLKLDQEINEDLYYMKKAFINMFNVYHYDYIFLED